MGKGPLTSAAAEDGSDEPRRIPRDKTRTAPLPPGLWVQPDGAYEGGAYGQERGRPLGT